MIKFADFTREQHQLAAQIGRRAQLEVFNPQGIDATVLDIAMDLAAVHQICPIDLQELADFEAADFGHDIAGIWRYLNRETGELGECFVPRCALPEERPLKFAGFMPGTRVRAYDFEPCEGRPERYAEGEIQEELEPDAMRARGLFPCHAYRIAVEVDTTCTVEPRPEIFAPLETTFDYDGRIQEVPHGT